MDNRDSSSSTLLFSPLPSRQSTPAQSSHAHASTPPTPSQAHTPTPLTISAQTIESDSKDFTEYANIETTPISVNKPHTPSTSTHTNWSLNKENALTTPLSASSAPAVRVRVSAKRLREIESPYNSSSASSLGRGSPPLKLDRPLTTTHPPPSHAKDRSGPGYQESPPVSGEASMQSVPGALTPGGATKRCNVKTKGAAGMIKAVCSKTSLRQGVLQTRLDPSAAEQSSSESLLIQTEAQAADKPSAQSSRNQLLHRKSCLADTSKAKSLFSVHPVVTAGLSQPSGLVSTLGQDPAAEQDNKVAPSAKWELDQRAANLVATCTAAATAALLATSQESSSRSYQPPQGLSDGAKNVSCDVTHQECKSDFGDQLDKGNAAKNIGPPKALNLLDRQQPHNMPLNLGSTGSKQLHSSLPSIADKPSGGRGVVSPKSLERWCPRESVGMGPHPQYAYSDLAARVNRMEELQHSQLMRIAKGPETDRLKKSEAGVPQRKSFASLVRDECCQTSPMDDTHTSAAAHMIVSEEGPTHSRSLATDRRVPGCTIVEVTDPAAQLQTQPPGTNERIMKENNAPSRSPTHDSCENTRPQLFESLVARPSRLEDSQPQRDGQLSVWPTGLEELQPQRDGLLTVARMLSKVQQAKVDIDLECALEEAQSQYTDLGELLQSADNSEEFTDVSWKVAKLLEEAYQDRLAEKEGEEMLPSDKAIVGATREKPPLKSMKRKENAKSGKASKASVQETKQRPTSTVPKGTSKKLSTRPNRVRVASSPTRLSRPARSRPSQWRGSESTHQSLPTTLTAPPVTASTTVTSRSINTHSTLTAPSYPILMPSSVNTFKNPPVHTITTHTTPPVTAHSTTLTAPPCRPVIPIGPPCMIPSPIYTTHEPETPPILSMATKPPPKVDKCTSTHSPPQEPGEETTAVSTVEVCLQTSLKSGSEVCLDKEVNEGNALEERILPEVDSPSETFSEGSERESEPFVAIPGCHRSPPPTPHPPPPSHHTHGVGECVTSEELNDRLQEQLESRAAEWVRQEVLMRVLSQMHRPLTDPATDSRPLNPSNSCSTCSLDSPRVADVCTDGAQLLISPTQTAANKINLLTAVKDEVKKELLNLAQELAKATNTEQRAKEDSSRYSYTPPETCSLSTTSVSSTDSHLLSTPRPTPPPSLTSSPDHTLTGEGVESLDTPPLTPPLPECPTPPSPPVDALLDTPQLSVDESSVSESVHKTATVSDHTHLDALTPLDTPTPPPPSIPSPPAPTESPTVTPLTEHTPHTQHTKELSSSDTSTTSTPSHPHSLTVTDSSTDQAISMGECVQMRPWLPHVNSSLSEGEVPLSPGDVRWGSLFVRAARTDPTVEALPEQKSSGDSCSDSQDCDLPRPDLSVGEVRKPRAPLADPFERFLHKVNTSTPDESSTRHNSSTENTLSELPSLNFDLPNLPYVKPVVRQKKTGLRKRGSPGEVIHLSAKSKAKAKKLDDDSSVSYPHSVGELPTRIKLLNKEARRRAKDIETVNETRDGIDVINVSRHSSKRSKLDTSSSELEDTLKSVSQISVKSSPDGMPELIQVQPVLGTPGDPVELSDSPLKNQKPLKMKSMSSVSEDLPISINLSELELTDTLTKHSGPPHSEDVAVAPSHEAGSPPPPLSGQRPTLSVTIPLASQGIIEEGKSEESYSSDFDFSSSMSIPLVD